MTLDDERVPGFTQFHDLHGAGEGLSYFISPPIRNSEIIPGFGPAWVELDGFLEESNGGLKIFPNGMEEAKTIGNGGLILVLPGEGL